MTNREAASSWILITWTSQDPPLSRFTGVTSEFAPYTDLLPGVVHVDFQLGLILVEDLGRQDLRDQIESLSSDSASRARTVGEVVDALIRWHSIEISANSQIAKSQMGLNEFLGESEWFGRYFIHEYCGLNLASNNSWLKDCQRLAREVSDLKPNTVIHRDFHSENIMIHGNRVRFVDFAGASIGPPEYDLVSLLYDPLINLDPLMIHALHLQYRKSLSRGNSILDQRATLICAAQRLMNVLGAYANFVLHRNKDRYVAVIPLALANIISVLDELSDFPHLMTAAQACQEEVGQSNIHRTRKPRRWSFR